MAELRRKYVFSVDIFNPPSFEDPPSPPYQSSAVVPDITIAIPGEWTDNMYGKEGGIPMSVKFNFGDKVKFLPNWLDWGHLDEEGWEKLDDENDVFEDFDWKRQLLASSPLAPCLFTVRVVDKDTGNTAELLPSFQQVPQQWGHQWRTWSSSFLLKNDQDEELRDRVVFSPFVERLEFEGNCFDNPINQPCDGSYARDGFISASMVRVFSVSKVAGSRGPPQLLHSVESLTLSFRIMTGYKVEEDDYEHMSPTQVLNVLSSTVKLPVYYEEGLKRASRSKRERE